MRLEQRGRDEVVVGAEADHVADVLGDLDELRAIVDGLVHDESTATRWVMARVRVGPLDLSPAVDLEVRRDGNDIALDGTPADGHTATWLEQRIRVRPVDGHRATVTTRWMVAVEVPGPRVLGSTLDLMMTSGARSIARQLAERLVDRFAHADDGAT